MDSPQQNLLNERKRKLFLRTYPFELPPESDDCDQGAYFDDDDELDDWDEYSD